MDPDDLDDSWDESEADLPLSDSVGGALLTPGAAKRIEGAAIDNTLAAFVELVNARDLDGLIDLMVPDVEAAFLGEATRGGVIEGLTDLLLRYPTLVVTRADLRDDPIVAAWTFHQDEDRYGPAGYFLFRLSDAAEPSIERLDYVEELADQDELVVEIPERSELPEWEDWSELDES